MAPKNDKVSPAPTFTEEQAHLFNKALVSLHSLMASYLPQESSKPLPVWEKCGKDEVSIILGRAQTAHVALKRQEWERKVAGIRSALSDIIAVRMTKAQKARKYYNDAPEDVREDLPKPSDSVFIPLTEVAAAFKEGTHIDTINKTLHDLDYKVGKKTDIPGIFVPFIPAADMSDTQVNAA